MSALPLLVRFGWVFAKLVVAIPALAGVGAIALRRRRRDRRVASAMIAARAANVSAPVEGHATVRGTYRTRAEDHWIELDGERIDLASAPDVLRGSRARWTWRMATPVHAIADGDEVIAEGRLARTADATADAAASYRRAAGAWVMTAPVIHAAHPAVCARPLGFTALWIACAIGVVAYLAGRTIGDVRWERPDSDDLRATDVIADHPRLALAAALPGHRDRALGDLEDMVDRAQVYSAGTDAELVELARLQGGCEAAARALVRQNRFAEAATESCSPGVQIEALLFLGRYAEANKLATDDNASRFDRGLAALGAGDWTKSAAIADELAAAVRSGAVVVVNEREAAAVNLDCFADLMRVHAGVATARAHLRTLAPRSAACGLIDALAHPIAEQPAALGALQLDESLRFRYDLDELAWSAGGVDRREDDLFSPIASSLDGESFSSTGWLAPFALAARDAPLARAWMVGHALLLGESPAAHLTALRTEIPRGNHGYDDVDALALVAALRTGAPLPDAADPIHPAVSDYVAARRGTRPRDHGDWLPAFEQDACEPLIAAMYAGARAGDGAPLAELLARCTLHWTRSPAIILSILPRLTRGRAEVAGALRTFRDLFGSSTLTLPFDFTSTAAMHRDLARAAGDPEDAARWQQIVSTHAAALADRDRVTALILWHSL